MRYSATPGAFAPGVREKDLHTASGLRIATVNHLLSQNLYGVFAQTGFGAIGAATAVTVWTSLRAYAAIWSDHLPFPITPLITFWVVPIDVILPSYVKVRLRVRGLDQFGSAIEEITPWIEKTMTDQSYLFGVYLSKVFSAVHDVEYMSDGVDGDSAVVSTMACGWSTIIDPTRVEDAATIVEYLAGYSNMSTVWDLLTGSTNGLTNFDLMATECNWGIGIPLEVAPFGPAIPHATPEILGAWATIIRASSTATVVMAGARIPVYGQMIASALPVTCVCVGRSAPGWQGCMSKIGFYSGDGWGTKILGLELGGSSQRAGLIPALAAQVGEDELMFNFLVRTTVGTGRGANPTTVYARG